MPVAGRVRSAGTPAHLEGEVAQGRELGDAVQPQGWLFLAVAVADFGFYVAVGSAGRAASRALSPLPALLVVVIFLAVSRQPVIGRDAARINKPVVMAALATAIAGLVLYQTVMPRGFTGWLVLLAAFMVTPLLAGAWRWFRS